MTELVKEHCTKLAGPAVQHLDNFEIWGPLVNVPGTLWIYQNICELFYLKKNKLQKVFNPLMS